ncbi:MAG: hypothetical protein R6V62_04390 [Candidatus Fermentibacteraceae bacterium]
MKRKLLFFVVVAAVLLAAGCDPFGTSETKAYITGRVYADSTMTTPFEGAMIVLDVNPDSVSMPTVSTLTNASGVFMLEIPFYPTMGEEGIGGYSFSGTGTCGVLAYALGKSYTYRTYDESPFTVTAGDTLVVWDIAITEFQ